MATNKFYQEGNKGFLIFPFADESTPTYSKSPIAIRGMISLEGTVSQTETKTPADDDIAYLIRRSSVTIEGTATFVGLSKSDYEAFYAGISDRNNAIVYGENTAKKIGFVFINTEHEIGADGSDTTTNKAHIFYAASFALPNISTTTLAEDDTTVRPFAITFTANPIMYTADDAKSHKVTYACIDSATNKADYDKIVKEGEATLYMPSFAQV